MLFSSITFLFVFLPCVLAIYYISPGRMKNSVLLAASLLFYAWGEPRLVLIMVAEIAITYLLGILIGKNIELNKKPLAKLCLGASLIVDIALLGYFKYADFFIETFGKLTGLPVSVLNIALPIGISFYTFQIISYTVDVYRGEVPPQKNPIILATYVAMFPQLIAGPIVRYSDIEKQLIKREHTVERFALGLRRFIIGLAKKVLIANAMGEICMTFRASGDPSVAYYWFYAVAFTLQIYFDFSGYSDMAIGLGKIFGFDFRENFNYPYISRSVTEFWRRWHISLGSWFRDYVYIPLGGNRVSRWRWFCNIAIVWFLTGLWHGAAWNFIAWGLFYAVFLVLEKKLYLEKLQNSKVLSHFYVMLLVVMGFVLFNGADMTQAASDIACMLGFGNLPLFSSEFLFYLKDYGFILTIAVIAATPLANNITKKISGTYHGFGMNPILEPVYLMGLLILVTAYLVDGTFNPFLYFRF